MSAKRLLVAAVAGLLCACSNSGGAALPTGNRQAAGPLVERLSSSGGFSKIQHVVIIMQENRSTDNLFYGYPNANVQPYGYNENGQKIELKPVDLQTGWDLSHDSYTFVTDCNAEGSNPHTDCQMNGFDEEYYQCGKSGFPRCPNANPPYSYVPHNETKPYFAMAQQYVLGDEMFASNFDFSDFVSHQYIVAGQADNTVNAPSGLWGCNGGPNDWIETLEGTRVHPCFGYTTLAKELDQAKLSWRYYTSSYNLSGGLWSAYQADKYVYYGPDWKKDVISPQTQFFSDVKAGKLRVVSWITPTCETSDHAGCESSGGPSWVASLVNAVGESKYWDSTAIFVFWSSAGGWYDHVPPPYLSDDSLGMRVPLLVISAYAKQNYVSHVQYEHGSMLRFVEDRFGLPPMAASDKRANSPEEDCFDFSQSPRKFTPIPTEYKQRQQ